MLQEVRSVTLSLELTPEEERHVEGARARGINVDALLKGVIASLPEMPMAPPGGRTGAQILAALEQNDALGSFTDRPDSPEYARELRRKAEARGDRL
jgi:hypothetical protein